MKQLFRIIFGFVVTLLGPFSVTGEIIETNEISSVLEYANPEALIFFNITGTLYQPSNTLSDHQWRDYFAERVRQIATDPQCGQMLIDQTKNWIVQKIPKKTVELKTPQLIADLQAKKIAVLGITQKQPSTTYAENFALVTHHHLTNLGIHLVTTLGFLEIKNEKALPPGYSFLYGILFTHSQPPGTPLTMFLNTLVKKPSVVVAVDNSLSSLENMQQAMGSEGIKFIGLRYGRTDVDKANFDPILGTIEFFTFLNEGRIISDAEALKLKEDPSHVNDGALLDAYIHNHLKDGLIHTLPEKRKM